MVVEVDKPFIGRQYFGKTSNNMVSREQRIHSNITVRHLRMGCYFLLDISNFRLNCISLPFWSTWLSICLRTLHKLVQAVSLPVSGQGLLCARGTDITSSTNWTSSGSMFSLFGFFFLSISKEGSSSVLLKFESSFGGVETVLLAFQRRLSLTCL